MSNLSFLAESFQTYSASNLIWILYPIAIFYIVFALKKDGRRMFLYPICFLLLTVFNPICVSILLNRFHFQTRYLRFFWIIPFYGTIAFAIVHFILHLPKKWGKILATAIFSCTIMLLGNCVFWGKDVFPYQKTSNQAFVNSEMLELSSIFHQDGIDFPRVLYGIDLVPQYRMYDPNVRALFSRSYCFKLMKLDYESFLDCNTKDVYKCIYSVFYYEDYSISKTDFVQALKECDTDYIVAPRNSKLSSYLASSDGLSFSGDSQNHTVYRVN